MIKELKEKYKRFCEWQKRPHRVKPMSQEEHDCPTCGTHFVGNYCPRCGQSSRIGRYSFKKAFLLFLDVWGLGNRGMFRTLRDLILRPGYMIRDYLQGMQMAYFPPFKMFFLLITFSLLVDTGLNIKLENRVELIQEQVVQSMNHLYEEQEQVAAEQEAKTAIEESKQLSDKLNKNVFDWTMRHVNIVMLVFIILLAGPLYLMFRKSPAYPDIKFSEFFVVMVYTTNMIALYSIIFNFFCLSPTLEMATYALTVIPLKQLFGYSYWLTVFKMLVAFVLFFIPFVLLSGLIGMFISA